jgi:putative PIN family toxin of toxin-antitoxin system
VLRYEKLQGKIRSLGTTPDTLLELVQTLSELHPATSVTVPELRDPKDLIILGTAIAAAADYIITGDRNLLILTEFSGIPILTPQTFLTQYFPSNE